MKHYKATSLSLVPILFFLILSSQPTKVSSTCLLRYPRDVCFELFNAVNNTIKTQRNIYELVQFFFPKAPFFTTQFINILYTVSYSNATSLQSCPGTSNKSDFIQPGERTMFLQGWSGTGVFNIISATDLTKIQLQLLNEILSLFVTPGTGIALPGTFSPMVYFENGSRINIQDQNFRVNLDVNIDMLSCKPSIQLMNQVLEDMTTRLKVIASTEGRPPERIEEDDLGYATEAAIIIPGAFPIQTEKFFSLLFVVCSAVLGTAALMISGKFFIDLYTFVAHGRNKFEYYFFALAAVAFAIDIAIVITEWWKLPQWCGIESLNSLINFQENQTTCDELIIIELVYQGGTFLFSLISAIVIAVVLAGNGGLKVRILLIILYTSLVWSLLFFIAMLAWSFIPTLLIAFVYPSIVISVVTLVLAAIFWVSVLLTVPFLMIHNLKDHLKCRHLVQYLIPLTGLFLGLLSAVLLTITYLFAAVYGSGVGGAAGLAVAVVPGLALTLFTEFYRDYFLTRIIGIDDGKKKGKGSIIKKKSTRKKPTDKEQNSTVNNNTSSQGNDQRRLGEGNTTDVEMVAINVSELPTQNGGKAERKEGDEGVESNHTDPAHHTEDGQQTEEEHEDEQGEQEEEKEKEEEEEQEEVYWRLRRSTEPAHILKQGLSKIYKSRRRSKNE